MVRQFLALFLLYYNIMEIESSDPRCSSPFGLFPDPTSCDRYISCWGGRGFSLTCGPRMVFNPITSSCQEGSQCPKVQPNIPFSGQPVRLLHSHQQGAGQLEIFTSRGWAQVVASSFHDEIANLVCQRLGYESASSWFSFMSLSQNAKFAHLSCEDGTESLLHCSPVICPTCDWREPSIAIKCSLASSSRCPPSSNIWQRWGDGCYLTKTDLLASREESYRLCKALGGNLASIDSQVEHEYISTMLGSRNFDREYYTDGAGIILANGGIMWAWQNTRFPLNYQRWWPGWNSSLKISKPILPAQLPSPACIILKRSYPPGNKNEANILGLSSSHHQIVTEYDSGFYFFSPADCSRKRPFICEAPLMDVGCREGNGITYSGNSNISSNGHQCLNWSNPIINNLIGRAVHARTTSTVFNTSLLGDHNYCRNPNGAPRPWCFVQAEETDECDIPECIQHLSISGNIPLRNSFKNSGTSIPVDKVSSSFQPSDDLLLSEKKGTIIEIDQSFANTSQRIDPSYKIRCKDEEYHCDRSDICLEEINICDGTRQCPEGDDEMSCKRFLASFDFSLGMTIISKDLIQVLYREDIGVCAKKCLDHLKCKGIIYNQKKRECGLSILNIGESGLIASTSEDFYEVISRKRSCGSKFKCNNGRCISKSSLCNGKNDCLDNSDEAKCLTPLEHFIKLTGGKNEGEGNIEINIQGKWGYICDDNFDWNDADVVCRELGYSLGAVKFTRNNHFGNNTKEWLRSSPHYWLSGLKCTGLESNIVSCLSSGLGHHDCGPTEISGVICRTEDNVSNECLHEQYKCSDGSNCIGRSLVCNGIMDCPDLSDESPELCEDWGVTRLLSSKGSPGNAIGTVHVKHKGTWGTVCDDYFDNNHAKVVCRNLGYETEWAKAYPKAYFGRGTGGVFIDEPGCKGHELHLSDCSTHTWGPGNCDHSEDVGVFCSDKEVLRIVDGKNQDEGRIEIFLSGVWGTICDDDFDDYDATVICRELGYKGGGMAHKRAYFGKGSGPVWLDNVDCTGDESSISECKVSLPGTSACSHAEDAGVTCFKHKPKSFEKSLNSKLPSNCGKRLSSFEHFYYDSVAKIVGGQTIRRLESPWLVSLQLKENGVQKHNCAGVVISEELVLTAAHCFRTHDKETYVLRVGDFDLFTKEISQEDFLIEKLYVHDDFDTKVEFNNDIALLKIARKNGRGIRLNGMVQPVCLPPIYAEYKNKSNCRIIGWGTTNERADPIPQRRPRAGNVKIFSMDTCVGPRKYGAHEITTGMFCAGQLDGSVDTCTGDSGGPLTCYENGQYVLYGITSWGKGCGRRGQPGMYTKITKYLRWLNTIIP